MTAARSRTASRRALAAAFIPPPAGYLITPAYRTHRPKSRHHADRHQPFNLCSAAKKWVVDNKDLLLEIAAIGGAILAGVACTAVTAGVGAIACMAGAGALISLAKDAAQGDIHSLGDALGSLGPGAMSGLLGGAGGAIAAKVGALVAKKVGTGLMGRLASEVAESGVEDAISQVATTGGWNPRAAAENMIPGLGALNGKGRGGGGARSNISGGSGSGGGGGVRRRRVVGTVLIRRRGC